MEALDKAVDISSDRERPPLLRIEGPPGSGKSLALVREGIRLQKELLSPGDSLLFVVFTHRQKQRIEQYLADECKKAGLSGIPATVQTLERFLYGMIRDVNPATALLSDSEGRLILQGIIEQVIDGTHPWFHAARHESLSLSSQVFAHVRHWLLHNIAPSDIAAINPLMGEIYTRYRDTLQQHSLLHYEDLAHQALALLEKPGMRERLRQRYRVVLIDEAQELSEPAYRFFHQWTNHLVLAGNERLSVRSYRGAEPELFRDPSTLYPVQTPLTLQASLRGNEPVLNLLGNWLGTPLFESHELDLDKLKSQLQFARFEDITAEAYAICDWIEQRVRKPVSVQETWTEEGSRPAAWHDFMILLRSSRDKEAILTACIERGIPVQMEGIPETLMPWQHWIYDGLCLMQTFEKLGLDTALNLPASASLPVAEHFYWVEKANRHLARWLGTLLENEADGLLLELTHELKSQDGEEETLLLESLRNWPRFEKALALLQCQYQAYAEGDSWQSWFWGCLEKEHAVFDWRADHLAAWSRFIGAISQLDDHYRNVHGFRLPLQSIIALYDTFWSEEQSGDTGSNRVRIISMHQAQGEEAPFVIIPYLTAERFPRRQSGMELLPAVEIEKLAGLSKLPPESLSPASDEAEEKRLLASAISRASKQVLLTSHGVMPSMFFTGLLQHKRAVLSAPLVPVLCQCELPEEAPPLFLSVDLCGRCQGKAKAPKPAEAARSPKGHWHQLQPYLPEPVYEAHETMFLSASSINLYMQCPQKYYYKQILKLPEDGNDAANLGLLIHRLMEAFNRSAGQQPYTVERLKALAEVMFIFSEDPVTFEQAGFQEKDRKMLAALSHLGLSDLRESLLQSVEDLARRGYFERFADARRIEAEMTLTDIEIEGLEHCLIRGSIDALIQRQDGRWEILDYKTYQPTKFSTNPGTCQTNFFKTLDPLPEGVEDHTEKFKDKLSSSYPKDYQLPLYYLALRSNPQYAGQIEGASLQLLRPPFKDNGSIRLELPTDHLEAALPGIIDDLNRHIVQPIRQSQTFSMNPDPRRCGYCSYLMICESRNGKAVEEDA